MIERPYVYLTGDEPDQAIREARALVAQNETGLVMVHARSLRMALQYTSTDDRENDSATALAVSLDWFVRGDIQGVSR